MELVTKPTLTPFEQISEALTVHIQYTELKQLIQRHKFQNMLDKYGDLYNLDLFGETIEGHRNINPYEWKPCEGKTILNTHVDEDRESLSSTPTIEGEDKESVCWYFFSILDKGDTDFTV